MVISGVIAYLGDALGTLVGKKRLSLFGMRPRFTALFVAISTGIIITLSTFGIGMMLSEDVRLALFSIDKLKKDKDVISIFARTVIFPNVDLRKFLYETLPPQAANDATTPAKAKILSMFVFIV